MNHFRRLVDLRSLALFRVLLGATIAADLIMRLGDLGVFYTDRGVLPRSALMALRPPSNAFSFHLMNGSEAFQALLFSLSLVLCLSLVIGYKSRLSCFLLWLLTISLQFRNPFLTEGFDVYARQLLFWASLVPIGAVWSIDRARAPRREIATYAYSSLPVAGLLLQVLILYLFAGLHKLDNPVWAGGDALQAIISAPSFYVRPFTASLGGLTHLLAFGTYFTLVIEIGFPILLLILPRAAWLRMAFVLLMGGLHVGIMICLDVGLFSVLSLAALSSFLPAEFWSALERYGATPLIAARRGWLRIVRKADRRSVQSVLGPGPEPLAIAGRGRRLALGALVVIIMSYVVVTNMGNFGRRYAPPYPRFVKELGYTFRFNQKWALFASTSPNPVYPQLHAIGRLKDGSLRTLTDGSAYDRDRIAASYRGSFPSHRWVKWFIKMRRIEEIRTLYAEYQCKSGATRFADSALQSVELHQVVVDWGRRPTSDTLIFSHWCGSRPATWQ